MSLDGCGRHAEALERLREAVEQAINIGADGRLLGCRIRLTGRTAIRHHLLISTDHLLAEARAAALGFGDSSAWIERVVIATESVLDPTILAERQDALGDLNRMLGNAAADTELLNQLEADVSEFVGPGVHLHEVRQIEALLLLPLVAPRGHSAVERDFHMRVCYAPLTA